MSYWLGLLRDWGVAAIVVVAGFVVWQTFATTTPLTQGPAPGFTLPALDGGELELASFGDDTVVLNFWFSDCGPCRSEIPELSAWARANPDVPVIGVSTDQLDINQLRTRARQLGIAYPVAHDRTVRVARDYGVGVFPTTVVVQGGEIRSVRTGALNGEMLSDLVAEASPGR